MSGQVSAVTAYSHVNRRSAGYHPSIWGDHFLSYPSNDESMDAKEMTKHQKLKEDVRSMLNAGHTVSQTLELIDAIQRLGVCYHFETEIDEHLRKMDKIFSPDDDDLYATSLKFRLLRQHGYNISCDIFNKFKDNQGKFKDSIVNDAKGMLSLYEATHLRIHGEEILDQALNFTTVHLQSMAPAQLSSPLADEISHALKQPIRKGLPRLEARNYFAFYERNPSCNKTLLSFAKLDFNILQKGHQRELSDITRWWKELDFKNKLPFARDRLVECYFWILGVYFEPEYFLARKILTKVIALTSTLDDIYDVFGTPRELELLTAEIERWDISAVDELPEYMKEFYKALLDVYSEIEEIMVNQGKSFAVFYAKEAMKNQARAYFHESKWFHQQYIPTLEEYMALALVTSGYSMLITTSLIGMGDIATKDSCDWLFNEPKMVKAASTICRLMDDIVSHKFEQKRGHVASSIECHMRQYKSTEEEATLEFQKQVNDAWKDINEEFLRPITSVPVAVLMRILNFARVIDVLYKNVDGYTNSGDFLKDFISSCWKIEEDMRVEN